MTTTDQSVDRVLAAGLPVALVFLNGDAPAGLDESMRRLARDNAGQLLVIKVRINDSPQTASRFQVGRTPAVIALRGGQPLTKAEGIGEKELEAHVAHLLGRGPKPESKQTARPAETRPAAGEQPAPGKPVAVTDASFDEMVLRSPEPVLVDFWAPWCGPCRMVEPAVEALARENAGRLRVAKVNVDHNPASAARYDVHGIPAMMVVKGGKVVERWSGALPEAMLKGRVMRWLA